MKTEGLAILLTTIQTLAIVLTLLGVMWQLRQFNRNMQNDAYSKVVEDYCKVSQTIIDKPHLNKLFYADNPAFGTLSSDQQDFYNYLALFIGVLERAYLLRQKNWIDEETWNT